jgi:hypothetical protein
VSGPLQLNQVSTLLLPVPLLGEDDAVLDSLVPGGGLVTRSLGEVEVWSAGITEHAQVLIRV